MTVVGRRGAEVVVTIGVWSTGGWDRETWHKQALPPIRTRAYRSMQKVRPEEIQVASEPGQWVYDGGSVGVAKIPAGVGNVGLHVTAT